MTQAEYCEAHAALCERNKDDLVSLDLIAKLDKYTNRLEEVLDNLLDPEEREKFWCGDI